METMPNAAGGTCGTPALADGRVLDAPLIDPLAAVPDGRRGRCRSRSFISACHCQTSVFGHEDQDRLGCLPGR